MSLSGQLVQGPGYAPGSVGDVFRLIRSQQAVSRPALARRTGLSSSTVGLRIDALVRLGIVTEAGEQESRGGRRARTLEVVPTAGYVAAVDLSAEHLEVALADLTGRFVARAELPGLDGQEPQQVVQTTWEQVQLLLGGAQLPVDALMGLAVGLPAPIEHPSGRVVLPSFMPSWHNVSLPTLFAAYTSVPVLVENDANLVALAESSVDRPDHLLALVLGQRIGSGIITEGRLHRGFNGAAGEISHSAVDGEAAISCICGIPNCLESVASGAAIMARLSALGHRPEPGTDMIDLGRTAEPEVIAVLREAGTRIGAVLASVVNFLNPREVVLSGMMSTSSPLVAAIRAQLFQQCLPIVTSDLEVRAAADPTGAGLRGACRLVLEEVLAAGRIEELVRAAAATTDRTA